MNVIKFYLFIHDYWPSDMSSKPSDTTPNSSRASFNKLPQLVLLGIAVGVVTALVMGLFRWLITLPTELVSGLGLSTSDPWVLFALPVTGSVLLWLFWSGQSKDSRRVGIPHLFEHLSYQHGALPFKNLLNQIVGATLAIGTGQPVGREGPGVHIGAAFSSWLGTKVGVSNSYQRLLIGCGSAAAIAALFNTPLAGVLFAMEVILLEYSLVGFTAIIVASISADAISRALFGSPELLGHSLKSSDLFAHLPVLVLLAVLIGVAAFLFHEIVTRLAKQRGQYWPAKLIFSGLLVGALVAYEPILFTPVHAVMLGTLDQAYAEQALFLLLLFYLFIPPLVIGLGIPGGMIGPSLTLGALIGSILGYQLIGTDFEIDQASLSLIAMAAMLSAVIHAPLAALLAVFELSGNVHTLTLALTVIVLSDLIMRSLFNRPSIFERLLLLQGLSRNTQIYRRVMTSHSVKELMIQLSESNADFATDEQVVIESKATLLQAMELMQSSGQDELLVSRKGRPIGRVLRDDIERFFKEASE
ncbi:H(+)/Cl(-) exchange transporter ClcA [Marinobacterium sp. xm-d-509]|nr:H(+)/Cl(-) exchange transporter ClcA [Marinobacterium sp. xm-g-48]NRP82961.1 H(+)/Cl(-) exchange transporter ClcA [Marinobacterium sp. xm-d-509]